MSVSPPPPDRFSEGVTSGLFLSSSLKTKRKQKLKGQQKLGREGKEDTRWGVFKRRKGRVAISYLCLASVVVVLFLVYRCSSLNKQQQHLLLLQQHRGTRRLASMKWAKDSEDEDSGDSNFLQYICEEREETEQQTGTSNDEQRNAARLPKLILSRRTKKKRNEKNNDGGDGEDDDVPPKKKKRKDDIEEQQDEGTAPLIAQFPAMMHARAGGSELVDAAAATGAAAATKAAAEAMRQDILKYVEEILADGNDDEVPIEGGGRYYNELLMDLEAGGEIYVRDEREQPQKNQAPLTGHFAILRPPAFVEEIHPDFSAGSGNKKTQRNTGKDRSDDGDNKKEKRYRGEDGEDGEDGTDETETGTETETDETDDDDEDYVGDDNDDDDDDYDDDSDDDDDDIDDGDDDNDDDDDDTDDDTDDTGDEGTSAAADDGAYPLQQQQQQGTRSSGRQDAPLPPPAAARPFVPEGAIVVNPLGRLPPEQEEIVNRKIHMRKYKMKTELAYLVGNYNEGGAYMVVCRKLLFKGNPALLVFSIPFPIPAEAAAAAADSPPQRQHRPDLRSHPFFRLPSVSPAASVRSFERKKWDLFRRRTLTETNALLRMKEILKKRKPLTSKDLRELLDNLELLVEHLFHQKQEIIDMMGPKYVVERQSIALILTDAIFGAAEVLGEKAKKEEWWEYVAGALPVYRYPSLSAATRSTAQPNLILGQLLQSALEFYRGGQRPPAALLVPLKQIVLCTESMPTLRRGPWARFEADDREWRLKPHRREQRRMQKGQQQQRGLQQVHQKVQLQVEQQLQKQQVKQQPQKQQVKQQLQKQQVKQQLQKQQVKQQLPMQQVKQQLPMQQVEQQQQQQQKSQAQQKVQRRMQDLQQQLQLMQQQLLQMEQQLRRGRRLRRQWRMQQQQAEEEEDLR